MPDAPRFPRCFVLAIVLWAGTVGCSGGSGDGSPSGGAGTTGRAGMTGTAGEPDGGSDAPVAGGGGTTGLAGAGGGAGLGASGTTGAGGVRDGGVDASTSGMAGTTGVGGAAGAGGASGASGTTGMAGAMAGTTGGAGMTGGAGTTGGAGATGRGGATGAVDGGAEGGACQSVALTFVPKAPIVYLLVDRSSSMFACLGATSTTPCAGASAWTVLRTSLLQTIQRMQAEIRFGFAAFNGPIGGACPSVEKVAPALGNHDAISSLYGSLPTPSPTDKWESPARRTLEMIASELQAAVTPGDKYLLFVTDGDPDYCGDGNALCPPDSVVGQLQTMKAAGITTIVFGLQTPLNDLPAAALQAFANAGAGEPAVAPVPSGGNVSAYFDQCFAGGDSSAAGWRADFLAKYPDCATSSSACRGRTIGTYGSAAGPTRPFTPNPANQSELEAQLSSTMSSLKSCVFQLAQFRVDRQRLAEARVSIDGGAIPLDATNGWRMSSDTELELVGSACATWRMPASEDISFHFPCDIILP